MPNPFLPLWEHIPDGEPRVFGNRVYLYGSHDTAYSDSFCDSKLKAWSASVNDLNHWTCHGDIFHSQADQDHPSDVSWYQNGRLFAPDVVCKDGRYYLFAYVFYAKGCVAVSNEPHGPFKLLSTYRYDGNDEFPSDVCNKGVMVDPGILVDDDGKVYIYCGYESSYVAQLDIQDISNVKANTCYQNIIPTEEPFRFFEACSPRKIGDIYYIIYSPRTGSQLVYATSQTPTGPFAYAAV